MINSLCIEAPLPRLGVHRHVPRQSRPTSRHYELSWNSCAREEQLLLNSRLSAYGQSNIKNLANQAISNAWPTTGNRPGYIESCASGHYNTTNLIHVAPAPDVNDQTETDKGRQNRRSTVTQKRQRNPDNREKSDNHRHIHDQVKEINPDDTHDNE
jgi:hypothetical protein